MKSYSDFIVIDEPEGYADVIDIRELRDKELVDYINNLNLED